MLKELKYLEELQLRGNDFEMTDSAQLTLLLRKLRVFVPPASEGRSDGPTQEEKHHPRINSSLEPHFARFWASLSKADWERPFVEILQNASSSPDACLKRLGLPRTYCSPFFLKGICLRRDCSFRHCHEDVDPETAYEITTILRKGYKVEQTWADAGMGTDTLAKRKLIPQF